MPILPEIEPFNADGGEIGVLLCHGFTSSPQSVLPWAKHLAAEGFTVSAPLLPGHGSTWQDLNTKIWQDWLVEIEREFDRLTQGCRSVFVGGLSMGGTLALRLAEQRKTEVAGLILVNPSLTTQRKAVWFLPLLSRLLSSGSPIANDIKKPGTTEWAYNRMPLQAMRQLTLLWRVARADLDRLSSPILLYRSREDHVVEPRSSELLRAGAHQVEITEHVLDNSFHVATLDNDAPTIFTGSVTWIRQQASNEKQRDCTDGRNIGQ